MRLFVLRNRASETAEVLALLECYERSESFFFELAPQADPWELPFILHEFAQRGSLTVDAAWSRRWVQSRLVPPERQNLGEVLRENGLASYDELKLLELTGGRCSQDECYLEPVVREQVPAWYKEREKSRLADVYALGGRRLMAAYRDGAVLVCDVRGLFEARRPFARLLKEETAFLRVSLQAGGHGAQWGSTLALSAAELRQIGQPLPLDTGDVALLVSQAVCDTAEAAQLLGCTRQNVSDLVRRGRLVPLKESGRTTLFLRAEILARR